MEAKVEAPERDGEEAAMEKADDMAMETKTHTIVRGDTFWELARSYYGDARMWTKIAEANPDARPRRLKIGAELTVPDAK